MNKKLLLKYIKLYIPFISGIILYSVGYVNLISSLLLFLGGYIAIKNTLDYRIVKKNIDKCKVENVKNNYLENREVTDVSCVKKKKRNIRVRKREK